MCIVALVREFQWCGELFEKWIDGGDCGDVVLGAGVLGRMEEPSGEYAV